MADIAERVVENLAMDGPGTIGDLAWALGLSYRQVSKALERVRKAPGDRIEMAGWIRCRNGAVCKIWRVRR